MSEQGQAAASTAVSGGKSKTVAALLALVLGTVGAQWFYLGRRRRGWWCVLFFWTGVPTLLGIRDAYRLYVLDEQRFDARVRQGWRADLPWSEKHWRLLRSYVTALIGLFVLVGATAPEEGSVTDAGTPLAWLIALAFVLLWFGSFLVLPYLLHKDKGTLAAHLDAVATPGRLSAVTALVLTGVTLGLYPLWYLYKRSKRVRAYLDSTAGRTGRGQAEATPGRGAPAPAGDGASTAGTPDGPTAETGGRERERLRETVASIRDSLDEAEQAVERGDTTGAAGRLVDLGDRIDGALAAARRQNASEQRRALERLSERLSDVRDAVEAGREPVAGAPAEIPGHPELDVVYADLFDEEPIGGGGNADVTRARYSTPDGDVTLAIKTPRLRGTLHGETVERLLGEAETWAKLDGHDNVVGVVDYGSQPLPWIAMEYMDAGHLGARAGELPTQQAVWTALGITRAVRHAHRHGVAHLDLKPENVLFRSVDGAWDVPKVADWGLSKHLLEHSNSVEGLTPTYAAPEQFDDDYGAVDDVTDVYQLGAVCYELFTGRPPFEGDGARVMRAVLEEEPTPPTEIDPNLPAALDDVLTTALAKDKDERYDSVVYVRDGLAALSRVE